MPDYHDPWSDPEPLPRPQVPSAAEPPQVELVPSDDEEVPYADEVASSALLPTVELVPRTGWAVAAWCLIVLVAAADLIISRLPAAPEPGPTADLELHILRLQGRYLVGANALDGGREGKQYLAELEKRGQSYEGLIHYAILQGELDSPEAALTTLRSMPFPADETPEAERIRKLRTLLVRLYDDYAAERWHTPAVSVADCQHLEQELGWYGRLATTPPQGLDAARRQQVLATARTTVLVLIAIGFGALALGLVGFVGLILFLIFACMGKLRSGVRTGVMHSGIYAETFALWMLLFLLMSLTLHGPLQEHVPDEHRLFVGGVLTLLTLGLLAWPVLRGVPWREVRADVGLTWGRQPLAEPFLGIGTYVLTLPLLVLGVLCMLVLQKLAGEFGVNLGLVADNNPVHPIVYELPRASGWKLFQIFFLACIVAPVVEEIMFRGVLYQQVRDGTSLLGRAGSVLLSALVVSFLFAVIHPQGFLAVPPLMGLAVGFTLAREWRGTLIPCIVAHGINNGLVLAAGVWMFRT